MMASRYCFCCEIPPQLQRAVASALTARRSKFLAVKFLRPTERHAGFRG